MGHVLSLLFNKIVWLILLKSNFLQLKNYLLNTFSMLLKVLYNGINLEFNSTSKKVDWIL